jgi:CRP-like cAMP-binding protein
MARIIGNRTSGDTARARAKSGLQRYQSIAALKPTLSDLSRPTNAGDDMKLHPHHKNALLARLPESVCERLRPDLILLEMKPGTVLDAEGGHQHQVYFPTDGVVSLLRVLKNGDCGEVAMVGNEGMVGISLLVDGYQTTTRAVVQVAGHAWSLRADAVAREFREDSEFQELVLRYTQAMMCQMGQVIMCGRKHSVEKQLCRWLLLSFDRACSDTLNVTHERIASALGIRREGVTEVIGRLQNLQMIKGARGEVRLLDRIGLEQQCCECYQVIRDEYTRLLGNADGSCASDEEQRRSANSA